MKKALSYSRLYHVIKGAQKDGPHKKLIGDCSGLLGDCSGLLGDCSGLLGDCSGLRGDCSGLRGDCSGLRGDCSGLLGDCSGLRGDIGKCEISDEERKSRVWIDDLAADEIRKEERR